MHGRVAAEREVCICVQGRALTADLDGGHVIAAHHVFFTVIVELATVFGDCHRHINRVDGLETVCHIERHAEVLVMVCELTFGKSHVSSTGISLTCRSLSAEGEVGNRVQGRILTINLNRGHLVTCHCMCLTVVISCVVRTRNVHRHFSRVNCLITIRHVERYTTEILVGVDELTFRKSHVGCSRYSPRCSIPTCKRIVIFSIHCRD